MFDCNYFYELVLYIIDLSPRAESLLLIPVRDNRKKLALFINIKGF